MNKIFLSGLALALIFSSCTGDVSVGEKINFETEIDEEILLLGRVNQAAFKLPNYKNWYDSTYRAYPLNTEILDEMKSALEEVEIKVFLGTWCSDTQREVPALYRILDELNFDQQRLTMIAVDRTKEQPKAEVEGYEIEYVPTLIFYRKQKEIGRIIESPELSLEEDMLAILNQSKN